MTPNPLLEALRDAHQNLPAGPARDRAAAAIQYAENRPEPADPQKPVMEAIIHGDRDRIERVCAALGIVPEYCITGDNGITFLMNSGPILLEAVAQTLKIDPGAMVQWTDLSEADQLAWGSIAAGNREWAAGKTDLDPFNMRILIDEDPGLLLRLTRPRPIVP